MEFNDPHQGNKTFDYFYRKQTTYAPAKRKVCCQYHPLDFNAIILFHLLVIAGIIPYDIVWGGRLESRSQMISFELISLAVNILIIALTAMKA